MGETLPNNNVSGVEKEPMSSLAGQSEPEPETAQEPNIPGPQTVHRYDGRIHVKGHVHNEICQAVMDIRKTTVDGGVEILEPLLDSAAHSAARRAVIAELQDLLNETSGQAYYNIEDTSNMDDEIKRRIAELEKENQE